MQFFSPMNFLALWIVPALLALFWISDKIWEKRLSQIGLLSTIKTKLIPTYRPKERKVRAFLLILVFVFSILALARPQWGEEKQKIQRKGVDLLFMLDTSLSMVAEDVKPNRLEKAKLEVKSMLKSLKGDRVGMITFAGSSFLQSPLTLDYSAFLLFLDSIKTGFIPDPGTSLSQALALTLKAFPEKDNKYRAVILLTDGEDNEGGLETVIPELKNAGIRVYGIVLGSPDGEPIPLKDEQGRKSGVKKDRTGQVVLTKSNLPLVEKIAAETGGIALPSTPAEQEIDIIIKHMQSLGKRQFQEKEVTEKEDHFQLFLFLAVLCLLLEMMSRSTVKIPVKGLSIVMLFFMTTGFLDSAQSLNEEGNKLFKEKKYQSALHSYQKAKSKEPENAAVRYNTGAALYQLEQYQEASQEFEKAVNMSGKDELTKQKALYNLGNAQYRLGKFEKAIESYQKALDMNPEDKDAKYNLEFLQNQKSMFDKKNDKQDKDKQNQQNKQNKQNQQQNQKNQQNNQQNEQNQQNQNQQNQDQQQNQQQNQNQDQQQQQNQQNQQQNQNQDQKDQQDQQKKQDQQNQGQGQQDQEQKDQQKNQDQQQNQQDQQEQEQKDQQKKDQEEQEKQDQQEQQGQGQQSEQEKEQQEKEQEQKDREKQQGQDEEKEEQENQGQQREQDQQEQGQEQEDQDQQNQGQKPDEQQQQRPAGAGRQPLQGQMSLENALSILDALKDSEKELQDLRRPPTNRDSVQVDKDW